MSTTDDSTTPSAPRRRRAASRPAGPPADVAGEPTGAVSAAAVSAPAAETPDLAPARPARKRAAKKAAPAAQAAPEPTEDAAPGPTEAAPATRSRTRKTTKASPPAASADTADASDSAAQDVTPPARRRSRATSSPTFSAPDPATAVSEREAAPLGMLMFQAPQAPDSASTPPARRRAPRASAAPAEAQPVEAPPEPDGADELEETFEADDVATRTEATGQDEEHEDGPRRRRRRGGRGRRRRTGEDLDTSTDGSDESTVAQDEADDAQPDDDAAAESNEPAEGRATSRRRRRRRGGSADSGTDGDDRPVTRVREPRARRGNDEITAIKGSTRLEAKKQRRREGREAGRRRPSILTEAEFLARREAVERVMVVRQLTDGTQIAVLEDGVLVEHYVNRSTGASMIGNVYLGKVQNVLPSMEAAFVDIGRGRNAVLYAGEVNWDAAGLDGQPRRIEAALKSGDSVLVQVSKDPIGHKGARLTSQISLPGRFLVYVPEGQMTGISRKLPDTERNRLKAILRTIVPEDAGVIVRTASEGASEDELTRDVQRLAEQWEQITAKAKSSSAPALLQGEQDLAIKVVRDIFNEDFSKLVVSGEQAWETIESYVSGVAPDLVDRLEKWAGPGEAFHTYRVDEQLAKALDRKVWLPSGGSLVIDRTEAMTVVDVNTGKFTGSGGNLEETVTRNNLEAAEEIVRQLRLRDIGGIIVVDFIDMVLESNRDLVLRRLLECLGRDRTKHQVAEVTSLGLVQMTRKRIGQGLLEVFSEPCEHCHGRGVLVHTEPIEARDGEDSSRPAIRSASASAGAAKVHAAARKAAAQALDEPAAQGLDEQEPTDEPAPKRKSGKAAKAKGRKKANADAPADSDGASADVVEPAAAFVVDGSAGPASVNGAAPAEAPTPRVRGSRRRVTRSAGPAALDASREATEPAV
ncbi:MAG TPA: Rne/Rng family ribonuclease [Candidatus Nanopelagicales bacterium]|jgi:ribonuclease E